MRLKDLALEVSNARDSEPNALRVYEVLVTTGMPSVRLEVRYHDELVVHLSCHEPQPADGEDKSDKKKDYNDTQGYI